MSSGPLIDSSKLMVSLFCRCLVYSVSMPAARHELSEIAQQF